MKILHSEIKLREETRSLEQAKSQLDSQVFHNQAEALANTQEELADRTERVMEDIQDLPEGSQKFAKELGQLQNANRAMWDATEILSQPNTGSPAIAAETDAIEWLLRAKRQKGGGGGGGSNPGGGQRNGSAGNISALALLGDSQERDRHDISRETRQATGKSGIEYPAEFRRGLDQYFEKREERK